MKDILQQIQNLKEDFMNLIEVEGLGQPASDVPPSTNKIKKDKKTKNGKVELVSVEDELFPYDGNKREQYRQKIIDTINGMIQGTATLEDLLQIVRQKKMPVKENLENQVEKKFKKGDINLDKAFDLIKKIESKMSSEKNNQERNDKIEKDAMKMSPSIERASYLRQVGKAIRRNQRKNALTFESMEQALCIAEDLEATITKKYGSMFGKSLEEALQLLESIILEAKSKDPEGYKKNIDIANHYDHLYSISPAKAPDGSPNSVAAEWNRRYQHYFNKAMKCYYGDGSKKKDSSNNKNFDKNEENEYNKCKALILWEQIINEIEDGAVNRAVDSARDIIAFARKIQGMSGSKELKDKIEDAIAKKNHQIEVVYSKKENKVIDRAKEDEAKKKKRK